MLIYAERIMVDIKRSKHMFSQRFELPTSPLKGNPWRTVTTTGGPRSGLATPGVEEHSSFVPRFPSRLGAFRLLYGDPSAGHKIGCSWKLCCVHAGGFCGLAAAGLGPQVTGETTRLVRF